MSKTRGQIDLKKWMDFIDDLPLEVNDINDDEANGVKVIKEKNGKPTVIEYQGNRYILQHPSQYRR